MSNYAATPLSRRLSAVTVTYTTRPLIQWAAGILLVALVFAVFVSAGSQRPTNPARSGAGYFWFGMAPLIFAMVISIQARSHFVTPAARLVPTYLAPHLVITAILATVFLALGPITGASAIGLAPIGSAALAICFGSLTVWAFHFPWLMLYLFAGMFSLTLSHISRFWMDPSLNATVFRLLFLVAGWWGFALWLKRLATMHEERDDYVIPPLAGALRRPSRNERAEQRKIVARQLNRHQWMATWLVDWRIDSALADHTITKAKLVHLGLCAHSALARAAWFWALFGGLWLAMAHWMKMPPAMILLQTVIFGSIMPSTSIVGVLDQKRSQFEGDLLRPMERSDFYAALALGCLRDLAVVVAMFALIPFTIASLYAPERVGYATVTSYIAQVATANLLLLSAHYYLMTKFGGMARIAILYVPMIAIVALNGWFWWISEVYGVGPILACSVAYAALAVLTLRAAHLRWLTVEVG